MARLGELGKVYVVWGPPYSGKTTYVKNNKHRKSIVLDMDYLQSAFELCDNVHMHSNCALGISTLVRNFVLDYVPVLILGGIDVWIITASPDKKVAEDFVKRFDAELITIDADASTCIEHFENDTSRNQDSLSAYNVIDKWFNDRKCVSKPLQQSSDKCISQSLQNFMEPLISEFNKQNIDYFITGSVGIYLETGISLGRVSSDLDLVLNKSDVEKVIAICDKLGYEYHDYRQNPLSIEGYIPHYCMINNEYAHSGIVLFDRLEDDTVVLCNSYVDNFGVIARYYYLDKAFLSCASEAKYNGVLYKLLSKDETFFHKLRYAREKDFQDYDKLKSCLDIERIKMFAKLFRDAKSCVTQSYFDGPSKIISISDGIEPDIF